MRLTISQEEILEIVEASIMARGITYSGAEFKVTPDEDEMDVYDLEIVFSDASIPSHKTDGAS